MPPKRELTEFDKVELEWKKMQTAELREKMQERQDNIARLDALRAKQLADFTKAQQILASRQRICKHRKGGRNNQFANGNDNNYSIVRNTYPTGELEIMCTRCFKTVRRPDPRNRKKDAETYARQLAEWKEWDSFPTDNSPSGGKIFEVIPNAA